MNDHNETITVAVIKPSTLEDCMRACCNLTAGKKRIAEEEGKVSAKMLEICRDTVIEVLGKLEDRETAFSVSFNHWQAKVEVELQRAVTNGLNSTGISSFKQYATNLSKALEYQAPLDELDKDGEWKLKTESSVRKWCKEHAEKLAAEKADKARKDAIASGLVADIKGENNAPKQDSDGAANVTQQDRDDDETVSVSGLDDEIQVRIMMFIEKAQEFQRRHNGVEQFVNYFDKTVGIKLDMLLGNQCSKLLADVAAAAGEEANRTEQQRTGTNG